MKVIFKEKEIELESATEEELSLDYLTPFENNTPNLEDTIELTDEEIANINKTIGEENE